MTDHDVLARLRSRWRHNNWHATREEKAALLRLLDADMDVMKYDVKKLLDGFDDGVFCRDTRGDGHEGWAIKALPYLLAMARVSAWIDEINPPKEVSDDPYA